MTVILVGVFSGLGFAAFENLMYGKLAILGTLLATEARGAAGLVEGVQVAMVMPMLRSLSLVFCHAVWAGIFAYFLAVATVTGRRWGAMFLVGLLLTATLHGVYDWLCSIQPTMAAFTAGVSFVLFYGYVAKIRGLVGAEASEVRPCPGAQPGSAG
jgi:RsiW-degrading membrane proteinase PrsW (M82 family)